jgi:hypothetical protein
VAFIGGCQIMVPTKIQVLFSQNVTGTGVKGAYDFWRHSCVVLDDTNQAIAVGDIITDTAIQPGIYPLSFTVNSFQGKLVGKIEPLLTVKK